MHLRHLPNNFNNYLPIARHYNYGRTRLIVFILQAMPKVVIISTPIDLFNKIYPFKRSNTEIVFRSIVSKGNFSLAIYTNAM